MWKVREIGGPCICPHTGVRITPEMLSAGASVVMSKDEMPSDSPAAMRSYREEAKAIMLAMLSACNSLDGHSFD